MTRDVCISYRLENDVKRLKADLQTSRNTEQELRCQINNYALGDKSMKSELYQLRQDNENLQNKWVTLDLFSLVAKSLHSIKADVFLYVTCWLCFSSY